MKILDLLVLATRSFQTRRLRTFLTILGVSVGIGAVLFLVSLGYGMQKLLLEKITTSESLLSLDVAPGKGGAVKITPSAISRIEKISGVKETSPLFSTSAQVSFKDISSDVAINAVKPSFFRLGGLEPLKGRIFTIQDKDSILVSKAVVMLLGQSEEAILDKDISLTFYFSDLATSTPPQSFKVLGVTSEEDTPVVYLPLRLIDSSHIREYQQLKVRVENPKIMGEVRDKLMSMGFLVSALSDTVEQANKIFKIIQIILAIFGLIALIVSAIGMANTMTVALLERTQEIGIMKAIGASRKDIAGLFLTESTLIGLLGGVGGVIIGIVSGFLFNAGINILARALGGQTVSLFYSPPWFILTIIIFSLFVGFFTGIFPARRAAKINTLQALRYK